MVPRSQDRLFQNCLRLTCFVKVHPFPAHVFSQSARLTSTCRTSNSIENQSRKCCYSELHACMLSSYFNPPLSMTSIRCKGPCSLLLVLCRLSPARQHKLPLCLHNLCCHAGVSQASTSNIEHELLHDDSLVAWGDATGTFFRAF